MKMKPEAVPALLSFGPVFMVTVGCFTNLLIPAHVMGTPGVVLGSVGVVAALIGAVGLSFGLCAMFRTVTVLKHQVACMEQLLAQKGLGARESDS